MMKKIITLIILFVPSALFAQVNIDQKMDLMKTNVEHADHNYKQNKNNRDISSQNVKELTNVVNELNKLKTNGLKDMEAAEENLKVLVDTKKKYLGYIQEEQGFVKAEERNIQKVKALLDQIMSNIAQRKKNIETYQNFVQSVDSKLKDWDGRKRSVASTLEMVEKKQAVAEKERKAWLNKTKLYKDEAAKWSKQKKVSEVNLNMFKKMRKK